MAYKCSFLDEQVYTAQDVNDIFARMSFGGVVFTDTGNTLSDLNTAVEAAVTQGVTRDTDSCKVYKENGVYKISKGACFMNDGSSIIFDENGAELEIIPDVKNYVYLMRDFVRNTISIVVSEEAGDEDTVPLAEIDRKGDIRDRRKYARAKVDLGAGCALRNFTVNLWSQYALSETATVDLGDGNFTRLIYWEGTADSGSKATPRVAVSKNVCELPEGEEIIFHIGEYDHTQMENLRITKNGQYLEIYVKKAISGNTYTLSLGVI